MGVWYNRGVNVFLRMAIIVVVLCVFGLRQASAETKLTLGECIESALQKQPAIKAGQGGCRSGTRS